MDDFNDRRGRYVDWSDIDLGPGGRDWKPPAEIPREPALRVMAPEPTSRAIEASGAVVAPQDRIRSGAVVDRRAEIEAARVAARGPVTADRANYLAAKQLRALGTRGLAILKQSLIQQK